MKRMMIALFLLSCTSAVAQNLQVYGGYNYLALNSSGSGSTSLNGWATGGEVGLPKVKYFSLAASISGAYSNQVVSGMKQSLHQHTYIVGPRLIQHVSRVRIFENAMLGAGQLKGRLGNQSDGTCSIALAFGGGADIRLSEHFSVRPAQLDYMLTRFAGDSQHNFRYSSGFVYRF